MNTVADRHMGRAALQRGVPASWFMWQ